MQRPKANPVGHPKGSVKPANVVPNLVEHAGAPDAPESLGDFGSVLWYDVWAAGGVAYNVKTDCYVIERYCSLSERRMELLDALSGGFVTIGSQGQEVAHPAARLLSDVEKMMVALEDRLGLSPEARLRVGISAMEHKSKLDAFMDDD